MQGRQLFVILAIAAAFGVLVPLYKGLDFLDNRIIVAYACLSAIVAASSVADVFAQPPAGSPIVKMVRVWLFSWGFAVVLLAIALTTVDVAIGHRILPRTTLLIAAECMGATSAAAVVALGAMLTRRVSANTTKTMFRFVFLIAVVALFLADRYGVATPPTSKMIRILYIGSPICAVAAAVLVAFYPKQADLAEPDDFTEPNV